MTCDSVSAPWQEFFSMMVIQDIISCHAHIVAIINSTIIEGLEQSLQSCNFDLTPRVLYGPTGTRVDVMKSHWGKLGQLLYH